MRCCYRKTTGYMYMTWHRIAILRQFSYHLMCVFDGVSNFKYENSKRNSIAMPINERGTKKEPMSTRWKKRTGTSKNDHIVLPRQSLKSGEYWTHCICEVHKKRAKENSESQTKNYNNSFIWFTRNACPRWMTSSILACSFVFSDHCWSKITNKFRLIEPPSSSSSSSSLYRHHISSHYWEPKNVRRLFNVPCMHFNA